MCNNIYLKAVEKIKRGGGKEGEEETKKTVEIAKRKEEETKKMVEAAEKKEDLTPTTNELA